MFYSHQLLAKKASLGQIWMAANMQAKFNRRELDKIDIIKICEEILNPPVPMALRLSSILMGGVVTVYQRKVKLFYDDVTRLLVEINAVWRMKPVSDPKILPKSKAKEQFAVPSNFCLDELDVENLCNDNDNHQVDAEDITLLDHLGLSTVDTNETFNHFERFTGVGDDETQIDFTPVIQNEPGSSIPHQADAAADNNEMEGGQEQKQQAENIPQQQPVRRRARRVHGHLIMDNEQLCIPGDVYQYWLQNTSDIVSKRGRTVRQCLKSINPIRSTKISTLMELPPVALATALGSFPAQVHYPAPLIDLWRKCTEESPANSPLPEGRSPISQQQEVSPDIHLDEIFMPDETASNSLEKHRANLENFEFQQINDTFSNNHFASPGSQAGQSSKSIPSSGSRPMFMPLEPEVQLPSERSKRKQNSSSRTSLGNLDPVEEELSLQQEVRGFKIRRLSEACPDPDLEPLMETGPTQTPLPASDTVFDKTTEEIRINLKLHFDTPEAPQHESLNHLAFNMNRKRAAQLFYQTCVLASSDFIKVEQREPYGDITISRGPKL